MGRRIPKVGRREERRGNKGEQSGAKNPRVGTREEQSGNKAEQSGTKNPKVGTREEQSGNKGEQSGAKNPTVGTREEQRGNKVGPRMVPSLFPFLSDLQVLSPTLFPLCSFSLPLRVIFLFPFLSHFVVHPLEGSCSDSVPTLFPFWPRLGVLGPTSFPFLPHFGILVPTLFPLCLGFLFQLCFCFVPILPHFGVLVSLFPLGVHSCPTLGFLFQLCFHFVPILTYARARPSSYPQSLAITRAFFKIVPMLLCFKMSRPLMFLHLTFT